MPKSLPLGTFNQLTAMSLIDSKTWLGADGYRVRVPAQVVWRLYHLMEGGISGRDELAVLVGLAPNLLRRLNLNRLHLSADNTWLVARRLSPSIPLPPAQKVRCRRCQSVIDSVPCCVCRGAQDFQIL